jgi:hypothetical protein
LSFNCRQLGGYRLLFLLRNVDLQTGALIEAYAPVLFPRSNIEVATLPVLGWLIEIEVVASYPPG